MFSGTFNAIRGKQNFACSDILQTRVDLDGGSPPTEKGSFVKPLNSISLKEEIQ